MGFVFTLGVKGTNDAPAYPSNISVVDCKTMPPGGGGGGIASTCHPGKTAYFSHIFHSMTTAEPHPPRLYIMTLKKGRRIAPCRRLEIFYQGNTSNNPRHDRPGAAKPKSLYCLHRSGYRFEGGAVAKTKPA